MCLKARKATPPVPLLDKRCPVLCMLDHLRSNGWVMVKSLVNHSAKSARDLDLREPSSKNAYFRCLIDWDRLLSLAPVDAHMPSSGSQSYYEFMLLKPWAAPFRSQLIVRLALVSGWLAWVFPSVLNCQAVAAPTSCGPGFPQSIRAILPGLPPLPRPPGN